ncbi:MAG: CDP-alcohol phosphatidyltransferase family protein [Candidatus Fermentibacter sp.]|nr:CDP-alcohol phosphatidyltransferase family protein [Candidatus Fermentibacter sp.]
MRGPFLTLPNLVSLSRIPLSLAASVMLWLDRPAAMAILASTAILTDWLDGFLARRSGTESEWGRILDPASDKIGFAAFGTALAASGRVPVWFLAFVVARDLLIALGGVLLRGRSAEVPASNVWGKAGTVVLSAYMVRQALAPSGAEVLIGLDALGLAALAALSAAALSYASRAART